MVTYIFVVIFIYLVVIIIIMVFFITLSIWDLDLLHYSFYSSLFKGV